MYGGMVTRALCVIRALYGGMQLIAPAPILDQRDPPVVRRLVRVLGARHVVQAVVTAPRPTPAVLAVGAQVDLLHASSMLLAAVAASERRARPLADGSVAVFLGILGFAAYASARQGRGEGIPSRGFPTRLLDVRDRAAQAIAAHTMPHAAGTK
jgi:hypothetical protein